MIKIYTVGVVFERFDEKPHFWLYGSHWRSKWTVTAAGGGVPKIFRLTWTFHCTFFHAQGRIDPYHEGRSISVRPETPRRVPLHRMRKTPPPPPPAGAGDAYRTDNERAVCLLRRWTVQ